MRSLYRLLLLPLLATALLAQEAPKPQRPPAFRVFASAQAAFVDQPGYTRHSAYAMSCSSHS